MKVCLGPRNIIHVCVANMVAVVCRMHSRDFNNVVLFYFCLLIACYSQAPTESPTWTDYSRFPNISVLERTTRERDDISRYLNVLQVKAVLNDLKLYVQ